LICFRFYCTCQQISFPCSRFKVFLQGEISLFFKNFSAGKAASKKHPDWQGLMLEIILNIP